MAITVPLVIISAFATLFTVMCRKKQQGEGAGCKGSLFGCAHVLLCPWHVMNPLVEQRTSTASWMKKAASRPIRVQC